MQFGELKIGSWFLLHETAYMKIKTDEMIHLSTGIRYKINIREKVTYIKPSINPLRVIRYSCLSELRRGDWFLLKGWVYVKIPAGAYCVQNGNKIDCSGEERVEVLE